MPVVTPSALFTEGASWSGPVGPNPSDNLTQGLEKSGFVETEKFVAHKKDGENSDSPVNLNTQHPAANNLPTSKRRVVENVSQIKDVLMLRQISLFWDPMCIVNHFMHNIVELMVKQEHQRNVDENGDEEETEEDLFAENKILPYRSIRFIESLLLSSNKKADYQTFANFRMAVIFPYAFAQFWFYELYQMGVPLFVPSRRVLPLYINQDYLHTGVGIRKGWTPPHSYDPFDDGLNLESMKYWARFADFFTTPHVGYFNSLAELVLTCVFGVERVSRRYASTIDSEDGDLSLSEIEDVNIDHIGDIDASQPLHQRIHNYEDWLVQRSKKMRMYSTKILSRNIEFWRKHLHRLLHTEDSSGTSSALTEKSGTVSEHVEIAAVSRKTGRIVDDKNISAKRKKTEIQYVRKLVPSRTTDQLGGHFHFGDLSTFQPTGCSSARDDGPAQKANDGIYLQHHPYEFHTDTNMGGSSSQYNFGIEGDNKAVFNEESFGDSKQANSLLWSEFYSKLFSPYDSEEEPDTEIVPYENYYHGNPEFEVPIQMLKEHMSVAEQSRENNHEPLDPKLLHTAGGYIDEHTLQPKIHHARNLHVRRYTGGNSWWWVNLRSPRQGPLNVTVWARDCCTDRYGGYLQLFLANQTDPFNRYDVAEYWEEYSAKLGKIGKFVSQSDGDGSSTKFEFHNDEIERAKSSLPASNINIMDTNMHQEPTFENNKYPAFFRDDVFDLCGEMYISDGEIKSTICEGSRGLSDNLFVFARVAHPSTYGKMVESRSSDLMLPEVLVSDL